jgi:hypothetical protein
MQQTMDKVLITIFSNQEEYNRETNVVPALMKHNQEGKGTSKNFIPKAVATGWKPNIMGS